MIFGIGIDIIENKRFYKWSNKKDFLNRYFNKEEIELCEKKGLGKNESLAARFAAKEALSKALGTGFSHFSLKDIIVLNDEKGMPFILLKEKALWPLEKYPSYKIFLSLSHEKKYSVAMVTIEILDTT